VLSFLVVIENNECLVLISSEQWLWLKPSSIVLMFLILNKIKD